MKIIDSDIEAVKFIYPDIFPDERGFFLESYNKKRYEEAGLYVNFVQDNFSKSVKGTVRGLHYQVGENAQGKLCFVILGKVLDVAVDQFLTLETGGQLEFADVDGLVVHIDHPADGQQNGLVEDAVNDHADDGDDDDDRCADEGAGLTALAFQPGKMFLRNDTGRFIFCHTTSHCNGVSGAARPRHPRK